MNSIPARLTFSSALLLLAYYTLSHTRLGTLLIPIRDAQTADNQVVLAVALATFVLVVMQIAACVPLGFLKNRFWASAMACVLRVPSWLFTSIGAVMCLNEALGNSAYWTPCLAYAATATLVLWQDYRLLKTARGSGTHT
ncbi:hypothetical protein GCM10009425_01450 [Pseudomonas asuensis]|uniref:Uncharacterized protein n=1 Tax=Pseudomonas asuensis TaxID=1825787 RepID=A0ABQ2GGE7_9PSED|nr:hypothetical protein [Pseudomonas asuensis]GGL94250.1 hypothetical protein GCM10009425_01450 [Pseudomonas asuensis]